MLLSLHCLELSGAVPNSLKRAVLSGAVPKSLNRAVLSGAVPNSLNRAVLSCAVPNSLNRAVLWEAPFVSRHVVHLHIFLLKLHACISYIIV